jgi:excisionase family DNA binding protein
MRLLRAREVAAMLNLSSAHRVYDLARRGMIPSVRIGRLLRFDPEALQTWIAQGGTPATAIPNGEEAEAVPPPNLPRHAGTER